MNDITTLKRLILVKRLYLDGTEKSGSRHNYLDQVLSVINLFLAVETLMRAIILDVDLQPNRVIGTKGYVKKPPSTEQVNDFKIGEHHNFEQLFNQVVAILRDDENLKIDEALFKWGAISSLQKARNDAQHGAKAPHPSDLPNLGLIAKNFIERILSLR